MDEQEKVADFIQKHELQSDPAFRILDLSAEVGEIAADATKSTSMGASLDELDVKSDEVGDALFSLLAVAESLDIDAGDALDDVLEKYRRRLEETGSAFSA
jgi:NTP pyrophosphatase (non-canonical NTP hydrolase)